MGEVVGPGDMERTKTVEWRLSQRTRGLFHGFCLRKLCNICNRTASYLGSKRRSKDFHWYVCSSLNVESGYLYSGGHVPLVAMPILQ